MIRIGHSAWWMMIQRMENKELFKNKAPGLEIIQLMCKMKKRRNQALKMSKKKKKALKMYSALTGTMINGRLYHKSKAKHWNATQYKNMTSSAEHLHLGKLSCKCSKATFSKIMNCLTFLNLENIHLNFWALPMKNSVCHIYVKA